MWVTVKYQCISLKLIWCHNACGRWQIITICMYPIKCKFADINILSWLFSKMSFNVMYARGVEVGGGRIIVLWRLWRFIDIYSRICLFSHLSVRPSVRPSVTFSFRTVTQNVLFILFLTKFLMSEKNFWMHFWPFQIDTQLFFWQNGCRWPVWMALQCQLSNLSEIFGWVMHVSSLKNVV